MQDTILLLEELHRNNPKPSFKTFYYVPVERHPNYMALKSILITEARKCPEALFNVLLSMELSEPVREILKIEGLIE